MKLIKFFKNKNKKSNENNWSLSLPNKGIQCLTRSLQFQCTHSISQLVLSICLELEEDVEHVLS